MYPLPIRSNPRPKTNKNMPHSQIGVDPIPEINTQLFRRCFSLPDVHDRPTVVSVPGARALWLSDDIELIHPEAIVRGREFAHIHPDGSLHAALPPERATHAIEQGWAEAHPVASLMGLDGLVMLYTPLDMQELDVIFELVVESYNYVTGRQVNADILLKYIDE